MKTAFAYLFVLLFLLGCKKQVNYSGEITVPDAIFKYTVDGQGIPCITLTGAENLGENLYPAELLENYQLIFADPGQVDTEILDTLSLERILKDFDLVRRHLGLKKIAILGHSMFSIVPLEFALKYPENTLLSISTGSIPYTKNFATTSTEYWESAASNERKAIFQNNMDSLMATDFSSLSGSEQFIAQYIASTPKYFNDPLFDQSGLWNGIEINMDFINNYFGRILNEYDNTANYSNITTPVLIITGKHDYVCPYYLWEDVYPNIPNSKFILYEEAGHNPSLEIPEKFTRDLVDWGGQYFK
jgi:pimeloyl-ACP methyl ester carboxylesterase